MKADEPADPIRVKNGSIADYRLMLKGAE